jgi:hypothetical protein
MNESSVLGNVLFPGISIEHFPILGLYVVTLEQVSQHIKEYLLQSSDLSLY